MLILLLNAGSSSLKCTVMDADQGRMIAQGLADWAGDSTRYRYVGPDDREHSEQVDWTGHADAVRRFIVDLLNQTPVALSARSNLAAVGHRVVHGGRLTASVPITSEVRSQLEDLRQLAPLHNPPSLEALDAAQSELPGIPHIAVFDTAFHATMPPEAYTYPVPSKWTRDWGIRRFGFHGLSHAYCSRRAAEMLDRPADGLRLVICHLGNGCSASAVRGGRCIETTMGFTPLEGLMMGTRSGSIDPGIITYVQQAHGLTSQQVEHALNRQSGLLGVSGVSSDLRQVLNSAESGQAQAQLALSIYVHRIRQAIGALTVTLDGIDALVFTAGVGENSAEIRSSVCANLGCLGLELDAKANAGCRPDTDIATQCSRGRILVIATREDIAMLQEVLSVVSTGGTKPGRRTNDL